MLGDLFATEEEILTGVSQGQVQSAYDRLPRNCADALKKPDPARKPGYPIGLKNQGATCYLNSLLQILFHTPELRKTILDLPLCLDSVSNKSDFLSHASKHKFMFGFQRLFSEMTEKDECAISTQYLNEAFGWEGKEHVQQHDIGEAMKIIFDTLQRALHQTQYEKEMNQLFKGVQSRYKNCRNCTITIDRLQDFYGLDVPVQGFNSLQQSMLSYLNAEAMEGDNKIFCETCESKQDMWLGTHLKTLPNILVFTLTRFTFDYEKMDRVKLNDFFSFNLQYNLAHFIDNAMPQDNQFQLYGVLIHRGSAHGGHYFCYIRDLMQQSNWEQGLQDAEKERQREKQQLEKEKQKNLTEQQKKRKAELEKEDKTYQLLEPQNKALLQNWYELNDSFVGAIDAKKITSKFQGSESGYILFYRRKGTPLPENLKVPHYFSSIIKEQNMKMSKEREEYEIKKRQIILKIEGEQQILDIGTKIMDFLAMFCPMGSTLVNEAKHNNLPYYPMELNSMKEYGETDTVESMDLIHESTWKLYQIDSDQYREIQPFIHPDKMPFELNILFEQKNQKVLLYLDHTLSDLKMKIQQRYGVSYEQQIIKLVTPYRQYFVTDNLSNDDVLLSKLGFLHETQIVLKRLQTGDNVDNVKNEAKEAQNNVICFVVERDDVQGIKRMYFEKQKTLQQLYLFIIESEALPIEVQRRFRNLNGDRLFYSNQYSMKLVDLNFDEEIVKIRIQRGQIPVKGDICVRAKIQSLFYTPREGQIVEGQNAQPIIYEHIFDPNATILEVKIKICELAKLQADKHRVYQTDWMGEPVRSVTKQKQSIFDAHFGKEEVICIRDLNSPIGSQLIPFTLYETKTGSPEDCNQISNIKIQEHKTLLDLKLLILASQLIKEGQEVKPQQLRVRQIKRDYMYGNILRDNNKELKNMGLNSNKLVVQILEHQEQLTDNQIVLLLKKRNKQKRTYEGYHQLIFNAGKNPSIQSLTEAVKQTLKLTPQQQIKIVKYIHYNFQWVEICEHEIDKFLKGKSNNEGKKKNKDKNINKKEGQKTQTQNIQNKKNDQKIQSQKKPEQDKPEIPKQQKVDQGQNKKQQKKANEKPKQNQEKKGKKGKNKGQPQKTKQQVKKEDCLNLRKAPYLLKDGDFIGYGLVSELLKDDLQTDDDLTLRELKRNQKKQTGYVLRRGEQHGFKVNIDF